jgi:sensor c-di-GMP phosphodiesterase-like protein
MLKKRMTLLVLLIGIFGIALPVLTALYLAHRQSMDAEMRLALAMTGELLQRADSAANQSITAYRKLANYRAADPCSDARIAQMRDTALELSQVEVIGYVANERLMCSSLGRHGEGIPLGPASYVSALGTKVRPSVDLGFGTAVKFLVVQKDDLAAALHPPSLIEDFQDRTGIAVGILGGTGKLRLSSHGAFDERWMARLGDAGSATFFDGRHLVAMQHSTYYDTVAYVAVPLDVLRSRLYGFASILIPIALALGAVLSFGIVKLAQQHASLPNEMRSALRRGDFELHYQPIVELPAGRIVGFEALMRWRHRDGTRLRPDLFIPVAEDCGLIPQVTAWLLKQVERDAPRLLALCPGCYISLNLGSSDLHSERIVEQLSTLLRTGGIEPRNIVVEATEHSFVDPLLASRIVAEIRALGVRVAIDDFGTGYSSLSKLTSLKTDFLKIDKAFVETVGTDSVTSEVALHIIRIAESMNLKVIGEGVEHQVQADFLHAHGVRYAQGWLFHAAMPIGEILKLPELVARGSPESTVELESPAAPNADPQSRLS